MSMRIFALSAISLLVWIFLTQYIAYLSNTKKVSSWIIDIWILGSLTVYSILLQFVLKSNELEIVCITGAEVAIAIPVLLIVRRWRLRKLSKKTRKNNEVTLSRKE